VALLGLITYVVIAGFAFMRGNLIDAKWRKSANLGFFITGFGMLFSLYLQTVSITQIRQLCGWCLSSAVTMFALFLVHGLMLQSGAPTEDADAPRDNKLTTVAAAALILAISGIGITRAQMKNAAESFYSSISFQGVEISEIVPGPSRLTGNEDAKVTLIEFADVNCPACRTTAVEVKKVFDKYGGRLRLGFRHFPLFQKEGHATSAPAAMMLEYAADQGKYFELLDKFFSPQNTQRVTSESGLYGMAEEVGLKPDEVRKALALDENDQNIYLDRVLEDFALAMERLKLPGTPAFILIAEGQEPKAVPFTDIDATLSREPYASLLKGG
jgi:protein-disulfide isomerase